MGNSSSSNHQTFKNLTVAIIGGSFAGFTMLQLLKDQFNVVVIDANEYFQVTPSIIKAPVNGSWANSGLVHFEEVVRGYKNSFNFVHGKVTEVAKNTLRI